MTFCLGMTMPAQAATTDVSSLDNTVYIETVSMPAGMASNLVVNMKNAEAVCGFGFDLVLPEGFDFAPNAEGSYFTMSLVRIEEKNLQTQDATVSATRTLKVVVNNKNNTAFSDNDGEVCRIPIKPSKELAPGTYTITLQNIALTNPSAQAIYPGGDKNTVLTTDITVTAYEADVLLDETSTTAPEAAEGVTVLVNRSLVAGVNTICLPFAMTADQLKAAFGDDVKLYDFAGYEYDDDTDEGELIKVKFNAATALEANRPYVIQVSKAISKFTVKNVDIDPSDDLTVKVKIKKNGEMTGNYIAGTEVEESCLFLYEGKFYYSTGATKMKAFRAFFEFYDELENKAAAKSRIAFDFNDDPTAIQGIGRSIASDSRIYSLRGQNMGEKMDKLPKGVYIVNGKKVVKK